ncbi:MAG: alpha/beta hydrolase, partial [Frankiaceae bacterium]|nr:alpha/beta hydrolase [Frankiaceae bacterium]MBV9369822.1 alpha/beta hydrolase [Frankiales bacterium]
ATFSLLLLDNRGTGQSELPADRDSLAFPRLADDIDAVRLALGLDRPVVLAHSAGCLVAMAWAAAHPSVPAAVILVTPPGRRTGDDMYDLPAIHAARAGEPWYAEAAEAVDLLDSADLPSGVRRELERAARPFAYGRWDETAQSHAAGTESQMSLRAWAGFDPGPSYDYTPMLDGLAAVDCPVLVVVGDRDGLTGAVIGERVASRFADARCVTIAGAGHYPWVDEPAPFGSAIREFLATG